MIAWLRSIRRRWQAKHPVRFRQGMTLKPGMCAELPLEALIGRERAEAVRRGEATISISNGSTYRLDSDGMKTLVRLGDVAWQARHPEEFIGFRKPQRQEEK